MTTGFQPNGFQSNAFQVDPITGYILATDGNDTALLNGAVVYPSGYIDTTDSNDTCNIQGTVSDAPAMDMHDGFTPEEIRRAKRLDQKIAERQRKLIEAQKLQNEQRKQSIRDLVDPRPVAKVKKTKVESAQEVKADIPLAETNELQRSIRYLENQRNNLLQAVAYRNEMARIQAHLAILEAKRLEDLDEEESVLALLL
jgi:hypothetical protein